MTVRLPPLVEIAIVVIVTAWWLKLIGEIAIFWFSRRERRAADEALERLKHELNKLKGGAA